MIIRLPVEIFAVFIMDEFEDLGPAEHPRNSSTIPEFANVITGG